MPIEPGTRLGRYEIRSKIGAGGMGEVYLAQDTELDRKVAIKFLSESLLADEQAKSRRDWALQRLQVDPFMDPLRDDPRFKSLIRRMGLPAQE